MRKRTTATRLATEQAPGTPADAEATAQDPGNAPLLRCSGSAAEPDVATGHIAAASLGQACESSPGSRDMTIKSLVDVASKLASECDESAVALCSAVQTLQGHHVSLLLRLPSAKKCGRLAIDSSDSTLEVCCHLGIATEHANYACSFAKALCRLCYRASYKIRKAREQIFPSSASSAKRTCARVRSYPTKYYLFGVHAQVSYYFVLKTFVL